VAITEDMHLYIQTIFDHFDKHGDWPLYGFLERSLVNEFDVTEVAKQLPYYFTNASESYYPDRQAILTVPALAICKGTEELLKNFIRTLRFCVDKYFDPSNDNHKVDFSSKDLIVHLKMPILTVRKIQRLIQCEPHITSDGVVNMEGSEWQYNISRDIRRFNDIKSIDEYLEIRMKPNNPFNPVTSLLDSDQFVPTRKVFIVHGHDNEAKQSAARFVEKLGFEAVIFHEQEDGGDTIIEKLERLSNVGYVIVLLTPDDIGYAQASPDKARPRARQNAIFEWGYFIAKLGRKNVIALLKDNVEILSDLQGVLWTKMDEAEGWKLKVAREMRAAGFVIDMNNV
jgi:predicted nucleotide-binding protein